MTEKHSAIAVPFAEPSEDEPLTDEEFERGLGAMVARRARASTGLAQHAFAARYGIPAGSLRDWEQGRRKPDAAALSYLRVITRMPEAVADALRMPVDREDRYVAP